MAAGRPERARLATEFGAAVWRTSSLMQLISQAAADRIGLNATDLNCPNILSFSGQMTAGELARATGLTTAPITGVADRLEEAGYVRRERDPTGPPPASRLRKSPIFSPRMSSRIALTDCRSAASSRGADHWGKAGLAYLLAAELTWWNPAGW